ncbi:hypothetical protein C8Q80DRAFT_520986 [Daedaleopsis nitida]|nr:hypothetical protein C8Q80DRAFT_520986 [Daedaleopsis nitida]
MLTDRCTGAYMYKCGGVRCSRRRRPCACSGERSSGASTVHDLEERRLDSSEAEASTVRRRLREGRAQRQHCPSMPMRTSESHCRSESTRRAHANAPEDGGRGVDPRSSLSKRGIRPSGALDTTLFTHLSSCACATVGRRPDRRVALGVEGTSRVESMDEEQSRAEAEEAWNGRRREGEEGGWDVPRTGHGETGTYTLPPPPLPQAPAHRPARSPSSPPVRPEEAQSTSHGPFPSTPGDAGRRTRASRAGRGGAGGDWEVRSLIPARGVSLVRLETCCGGRSVYDGEKNRGLGDEFGRERGGRCGRGGRGRGRAFCVIGLEICPL